MRYPFHPIAAIFPLLGDADMALLIDDIRTHGLRDPILLYEGMILDGRNRALACDQSNIPPRYTTFTGTPERAIAYVWSTNMRRRHLTSSQCALAEAKCQEVSATYIAKVQALAEQAKQRQAANMPRKGQKGFQTRPMVGQLIAQPLASKSSDARKTTAIRAATAHTNRQYIADATKIVKEYPEYVPAIESGEKTIPQVKRELKRKTLPPPAPSASPATLQRLTLIVGKAECLPLPDASVDIIITSPPYNIGPKKGRPEQREDGRSLNGGRAWAGIEGETVLPEAQYQAWQLAVLKELYRVIKPGGSLFYNHKVRQRQGAMIHPMQWLLQVEGWTLRQEVVWDRRSTHNHEPTYFWPHDERIYWLTKGTPTLAREGIQQSTVWTFHGPVSDTWHVSPFPDELPRRCLTAVGATGKIVLDPFGGSMTVCSTALAMGATQVIGCDSNLGHVKRAAEEHGWLRFRS